jgi:hypothetical protein
LQAAEKGAIFAPFLFNGFIGLFAVFDLIVIAPPMAVNGMV